MWNFAYATPTKFMHLHHSRWHREERKGHRGAPGARNCRRRWRRIVPRRRAIAAQLWREDRALREEELKIGPHPLDSAAAARGKNVAAADSLADSRFFAYASELAARPRSLSNPLELSRALLSSLSIPQSTPRKAGKDLLADSFLQPRRRIHIHCLFWTAAGQWRRSGAPLFQTIKDFLLTLWHLFRISLRGTVHSFQDMAFVFSGF